MTVGGALDALDAGRHLALDDNSGGAGGLDAGRDGAKERVDVFALAFDRGDAVALEGLLEVVAVQVLARVAGNLCMRVSSIEQDAWNGCTVTSLSSKKSLMLSCVRGLIEFPIRME